MSAAERFPRPGSLLAVELRDVGLLLVGDDGPRGAASSGHALVGRPLLFGEQAREAARLRPRSVHHRFWHDLDVVEIGRPYPPKLRTADLAHAHLRAVWDGVGGAEGAILAVPGTSSERQLGVLLGVAEAAGVPVVGLVDLALAAAVELAPTADLLLHLDIHLHRVVVTQIRRHGDAWVRGEVHAPPGEGLEALRGRWRRLVAERFVAETRFDPLHGAGSEAQLDRRLPGWLDSLRRAGKARAVLTTAGGEERGVELRRDQLTATAGAVYDALAEGIDALRRPREPARLLFSHEAASLPGLAERLAELGDIESAELPVGAAGRGALRARRAIVDGERGGSSGGSKTYVLRLPAES